MKKHCLHGSLVITALLLQPLLFALRNRGTRSDLAVFNSLLESTFSWQSSTLSLNQAPDPPSHARLLGCSVPDLEGDGLPRGRCRMSLEDKLVGYLGQLERDG